MREHGFVAVTVAAGGSPEALRSTLGAAGVPPVEVFCCGQVLVAHWGLSLTTGNLMLLTQTVRTRRRDLDSEAISELLDGRRGTVADVIPPFGALIVDDQAIEMIADSMGLRQLYHGGIGRHAGLSSSALLLGRVLGAGLDPAAIAVQSLLGWQLGQRTVVQGVTKLEPGAVARLSGQGLVVTQPTRTDPVPLSRPEAVRRAADLLREALGALLDDRPEVVLQLTGGQDSRLLLSAIPPARRRDLAAMTLGDPGNGDVDTASVIAERYALRHEVHGLAGLDQMDPEEAWSRCLSAASRLDAMSDPLAFAGLEWAESKFIRAPRLSGLGGEVARGFYYLGPGRNAEVTSRRARQLAGWRMFANESAEAASLSPEFRSWARERALADVESLLRAAGPNWLRATDELYLRHRMQRWAGVTETAWCLTREIFNPMLDHDFLDLARRMSPSDKRNSRFLAELQMELDPELGRLPLEGRPAPVSYTRRSWTGSAERMASTGRRLASKMKQRAGRAHRPPAGGAVLAAKIVQHWRRHPEVLGHLSALGVLDDQWLCDVLEDRTDPEPSSVAFVSNLTLMSTRVPELTGSKHKF